MGMVSEDLTEEAHLSKNMKVGGEDKVQRSGERCALGVFKEEPGDQRDWAQSKERPAGDGIGRGPEARARRIS